MWQAFATARQYLRIVGVRGLTLSLMGKLLRHSFHLRMRHPLASIPCTIRCPSSDVLTYAQVFLDREYDFRIHHPPQVIIDAGAIEP